MRVIVYGAGAVGGVIGARLAAHGVDVMLIARGAHAAAIAADGLRVEAPDGVETLRLPVVEHPGALRWTADDVVLLTMKSQHTVEALDALAALAPADLPIVCAQNGVANEPAALRRFANVYAVCVMCPTSFLQPGVVQAHAAPISGILDIGRYPNGVDALAAALATTFERGPFVAAPRPDVMRWKYAKLLLNLGNAVEVISGPLARQGEAATRARREGEQVLRAAGIDFASEDEDRQRRGTILRMAPIAGQRRGGGSSWQSVARRAGSIEIDYLNGEIVLLGRQLGIPTPVNARLQRLAHAVARSGAAPGQMPADELLRRLDA
jgi:2-dehydropantoate 2-reductase